MKDFYIAGVQFHNSAQVQDKLEVGMELIMRPEPNNKYDPNAVALIYNDDGKEDDCMIGYVPAKFSGEVSAILLTSDNVKCVLTEVELTAKTWERFKVEIKEDFNCDDEMDAHKYDPYDDLEDELKNGKD